MNQEEYLKIIINYVFDDRFTRALLIDGDWGCGKSYFVKEKLLNRICNPFDYIDSSSHNEPQVVQPSTKKHLPILISLYGVSSIEDIQNRLYTAFIYNYFSQPKYKRYLSILNYSAPFGPIILDGVGELIGINKSIKGLNNTIWKQVISNFKDEIVFVFDDFERCQLDIFELMGFINNLSENNGYKTIIVANEKEIEKKDNDIALAIQEQTNLIDSYCNSKTDSSNKKENEPQPSYRVKFKNETNNKVNSLNDNHDLELLSGVSSYERTREKLIGLTIHFKTEIESVYEDIAKQLVKDDFFNYLMLNKDLIIKVFNYANHNNLRTLKSVFIAAKAIIENISVNLSQDLIMSCKKYNFDYNSVISEIKNRILVYITSSAISRANGFNSLKESNLYSINMDFGFRYYNATLSFQFVDEYWLTLLPNLNSMNSTIERIVIETINRELLKSINSEYRELALFKLYYWTDLEDSEVKSLIKQMRKELQEKKYYFKDFKQIIVLLLNLNDSSFGMFTGQDNQINELSEVDLNRYYECWEKENVNEYVKLMLKYFELDNFEYDLQEIYPLSYSTVSKDTYLSIVQPIVDVINTRELESVFINENGEDIFNSNTSDFLAIFAKNKDLYMSKNHFFSLYGHERFSNILKNGTIEQISDLRSAIRTVYYFGNLDEFYSADYNEVSVLYNLLKDDRENGREQYNPNKSRTREIALRTFEVDLQKYMSLLKK